MMRKGLEQKLRKLIAIRLIKKRNQLRKKFKRLDSNIHPLFNRSDECGIAKGTVTDDNDFAFSMNALILTALSAGINVLGETRVVPLIF